MNEDIKNVIDQELNKIDSSTLMNHQDDFSKNVDRVVYINNKQVREDEEYRKRLIDKLNQLKENNSNIDFQEDMSIEELEDIIRNN